MTASYEHGTLAALTAGNSDGTITVGDLLKHGSMGAGVFTGLDGEVVILNGEAYQAVSSGQINHITDTGATTPFVSVHFLAEQQDITLRNVNFAKLNNDFIKEHQPVNVSAFLQLSGEFKHIKIRTAPKQEKLYSTLPDVTQYQSELAADNIAGTIIGYCTPEIFGTVTAAGWYLHFISDDHQLAGHLLVFDTSKLTGSFGVFDNLEQCLPIDDKEFRESTVDMSALRDGIAKLEGNAD